MRYNYNKRICDHLALHGNGRNNLVKIMHYIIVCVLGLQVVYP